VALTLASGIEYFVNARGLLGPGGPSGGTPPDIPSGESPPGGSDEP
jgi:hypothetical protein